MYESFFFLKAELCQIKCVFWLIDWPFSHTWLKSFLKSSKLFTVSVGYHINVRVGTCKRCFILKFCQILSAMFASDFLPTLCGVCKLMCLPAANHQNKTWCVSVVEERGQGLLVPLISLTRMAEIQSVCCNTSILSLWDLSLSSYWKFYFSFSIQRWWLKKKVSNNTWKRNTILTHMFLYLGGTFKLVVPSSAARARARSRSGPWTGPGTGTAITAVFPIILGSWVRGWEKRIIYYSYTILSCF